MKKILLLFSIPIVLLGQWNPNANNPQGFNLNAPAPSSVNSISLSSPGGQQGVNNFCYWVIAKYAVGDSQASNSSCIGNVQTTSTVNVSWIQPTFVSAPTGYDILRNTVNVFPANPTCSNCLVSSNQPGTTFSDNLAAGTSYTPNPSVAYTSHTLLDMSGSLGPFPVVTNDTAWSFPKVIVNGLPFTSGLNDPGANGYVVRTAPGVTVARTFTGSGGVTVTNGNGVGGNTNISIGVPISATLLGSDGGGNIIAAPLNSANIFVGSVGNLPVARGVSGDISINNTGGTTVGGTNNLTLPLNASFLATNASRQIVPASFSGTVPLNNTHLFVGNAGNIATDVAASLDVSLANTGAFTVVGVQGAAIPVSATITGTNASRQFVATALNSAHIFIGSAGNLPVDNAVTGDVTLTNAGATTVTIVHYAAVLFAGLGTPANGTQVYCSDCTITSAIDDTCANTGSGAMASRINGAWKCFQ